MLHNLWAKWQNVGHGLQWKEVLKFLLGEESVNKDNSNEDDSLVDYDETTAVDVSTDTGNDVEDLSSEEGSEVSSACNLLFPV